MADSTDPLERAIMALAVLDPAALDPVAAAAFEEAREALKAAVAEREAHQDVVREAIRLIDALDELNAVPEGDTTLFMRRAEEVEAAEDDLVDALNRVVGGPEDEGESSDAMLQDALDHYDAEQLGDDDAEEERSLRQ